MSLDTLWNAQFAPWLVAPVFGFAIGYLTNALAVRMLFRPHRPVRLGPFTIQGMIPRRKPQIAAVVASTIATELLHEKSLSERVADEEFQRAAAEMAGRVVQGYLARDHGSLRGRLSAEQVALLGGVVEKLLVEGAGRVQVWADTEPGRRAVAGWARTLASKSPRELVGSQTTLLAAALADGARRWLASGAARGELRTLLGSVSVRLAASDKPLAALLPPAATETLQSVVSAAMPSLLQRFEALLMSEPNVMRIKRAVRSGVDAYLIRTDGGLVKNVARSVALMGRDKIVREVDALVDDNLGRAGEWIYTEENKVRLEEALRDAVTDILGRTPAELLDGVDPATLDALFDTVAARVAGELSHPEVAAKLGEALHREAQLALERPVGQWLVGEGDGSVRLETMAREALAGGLLTRIARGEAPMVTTMLLDLPIGRPDRFLPPELVRETVTLVVGGLMPLAARRMPELLELVGVESLIEREILSLSSERVEQVILSVASRELKAITWWGGVLGGMVGIGQAALSSWLR